MEKARKPEKNYYEEISNALKEYECFKHYPFHSMEWIADRIDWCWKNH